MYGTSTTRNVTISGGVAKLAETIGPNRNTEKRDVTLKIYYGESENELEECETKTVKQMGCNCGVFFAEDSFNVEISTFGVEVGETVGSYIKKSDTCSDDNIEAYLTSNGVEYPLSCSNEVVTLGGDINIPENIEHNGVKFYLVVKYAGIQCDSAEITQNGVACNCSDINGEGRVSELSVIPKEGLPVGSKIGEYNLYGIQCSDDNDKLKIEEVDEKIQIKLQNGMILTDSVIENNEEAYEIEYNFVVSYNVNEKWRECKTITTKQKGLECSCEMVNVKGDGWVSFPTSGTRGLVKFAEADTGLYKYKGTPDEELVGVCGSLSADCKCSTIVKHDGNNVTIVPIPLTEEEEAKGIVMPYKYEFYVDLEPIDSTVIVSQRADLYFIPKDSEEAIECSTDAFGFLYDPNACNCQMSSLVQNPTTVPCAGYDTVKKLATVTSTHTEMTITAELLENGQEYDISAESITGATYVEEENKINLIAGGGLVLISLDASDYLNEGETINRVSINNGNLVVRVLRSTGRYADKNFELVPIVSGKTYVNSVTTYITDFTTSISGRTLTISGKVPTNGETVQRQIGVVRVNYWCNKDKINEWHCGFIDSALVQGKGCTCDCDYVRNQQTKLYNWEINFKYTESDSYVLLNGLSGNKDCAHYRLDNTDESGYVYLEWCKVRLEKDVNGWYLHAYIIDETTPHANRSTGVTVYYEYLSGINEETGEPIYTNCGQENVTITDKVCDCEALNDDSFDDLTVTISAGTMSGYTNWYSIDIFNVYDCIQLYIDDNGTVKGTSSSISDRYYYKEGDENIFSAYINGTYVYVSLSKDLDPSKTYTFTVKPRYKLENGDWSEPCDYEATVTVVQKKCNCNNFKDKVTTYTSFSYSQRDTGEQTINVAYVNDSCGKGTLFVFDSNDNKYCANDIRSDSFPDELKYIIGITEPCAGGDLSLVVSPLDENNTSRTTKIGVSLCDEEGEGCKFPEETCEKTYTINETWSYDCDYVSCSDYSFNLTKEAIGEFEIPCNTTVSHTLVAKYNAPPECFTVEATTTNEYITVSQSDMGNGKIGIYIDALPSDQVVSPTIDVNVYKSGTACQSYYKRIDIKICKQN